MTLKDLVVFDTLHVHQLEVEPRRVRAAYTLVFPDGSQSERELIYSYGSAYFDPKDARDINLASMMVAQVALNYGLFCKNFVFDGLYDAADRRFLEDMLENTSREILTNKIWIDNPFLTEPYRNITRERKKHYTVAKLEFRNTQYGALKLIPELTETLADHYAILSSGGKDSLLGYGLVSELGVPHPVFVNESGRHWFTAVNAHRYLAERDPKTAKPWCNSDRIFNWMLHQMPFIRKDFAEVRADIYPIRLWTVAVFLFGVLPVARKRRAGNILIGNEYDTTVTGEHEGIRHYHGLYDQSKYFDNALTRYYARKGWNIKQYSMLRCLSELLILKILVKRYPDLQRQQVSCHAAHEQDGRMMPCGRCEKCRRIIGMLVALEEDPGRCGYTPEQIEMGLADLSKRSVKQIGSDAAHLYYLLLDSGKLPDTEHVRRLAKAYPRIMQLRFDRERSAMEDLPVAVRRPLLALLAPYSDGCAVRREGHWQETGLDELDYDIPYKPLNSKENAN